MEKEAKFKNFSLLLAAGFLVLAYWLSNYCAAFGWLRVVCHAV